MNYSWHITVVANVPCKDSIAFYSQINIKCGSGLTHPHYALSGLLLQALSDRRSLYPSIMIRLPDDSITVEEISSTKSFLELRDEWRALEKSMCRTSVFLTHDWFSAAWQWRRRDGLLSILVVRQKGQMIGACPLLKTTANRKLFKYTRLEYLAIPDSQECLILAKASLESLVHNAIFANLAARSDWDTLEVEQIPEDSSAWDSLHSQKVRSGIAIGYRSGGTNPTVPLSGTWQEYYARRSRRLKKGNNHIANKLKRQYAEISVECHYYSRWPDDLFQESYENLIATSTRSWKSGETRSSFDHEGPEAWLRGISTAAAERGWLAVWVLKLDGQCVATEMQLIRDGIISALRADFDNALRDLSPGAYLNWKILERLFSQDMGNLTEYRMGPGANPYKARWSEQELRMGHAVLYNRTYKARLIRLIDERVKSTLRSTIKLLSRRQ